MKSGPVMLCIDTSVTKEVAVELRIRGKTMGEKLTGKNTQAQALLPLIAVLLSEHNLTFGDITEISVVPGPGSFTGLRVGFAVANMLGALLEIPINGFPVLSTGKKTLATPVYT